MITEHIVCNCNMAWASVLPPPPCGTHGGYAMVRVTPVVALPVTTNRLVLSTVTW